MNSMTQTPRRGQIWLLVVLAIVLWAAVAYMLDQWHIRELGDDTRHRYVACQAFYEGLDPYSPEVDARIDSFTGDGQSFWYPAHICITLAPMWFLPYEIAVSGWRSLNFLFLLALPAIYMFGFLGQRLPIWKMLLLTVTVFIGYRYVGMTIILAQYTGYVLACMVGAIWFLSRKQQMPAAILLALMSIRPDGVVLSLGLMLIALLTKQRRVPLYWGGLMVVFWAATALFEPFWVLNFINQVRNYRAVGGIFLPLLLGPVFGVFFGVGVLALFVYLFRRVWNAYPAGEMRIIAASTTVITGILLIIPHTNPYTLIYALPTYFFVLYIAEGRPIFWWITLLSIPFWAHGLNFLQFGYDQVFVPLTVAGLFVAAVLQLPTEAHAETSAQPLLDRA